MSLRAGLCAATRELRDRALLPQNDSEGTSEYTAVLGLAERLCGRQNVRGRLCELAACKTLGLRLKNYTLMRAAELN